MSDPLFDWVPFFEELATKLRQFRNRQHELIQVLIELKAAGHLVPSLTDRGPNGVDLPLAEIDPFTFLASLNRGITDARRLALARAFKDRFKLATEVPRSFAGVPVVDNRKTWFFAFSVDRDPADIPSLWDVFELALNTDPLSDPQFAVALDRAFNIRGVRINITMGLFWIRPRIFPSLDSVLLKYLGLPSPSKLNSTNYFNAVRAITARGTDYVQLSYDAWMAAAAPETPPDEAPNAETLESLDRDPLDAPIFWFVGASWQPGGDQTERFLSEGVWENGFHDGSLREEVRSMRPGERIAIKATYTRKRGLPFPTNGGSVSVMRIKVIGTIVENPGDGQRVHVRWDSSFAPKEWYFFTNQRTLWSVSRGANPYSDFLIAFTFYGATQNYEWFVSQSYWQRQISGPPKSGVASPVAEKPNDEDAEFDDEASTPPYGVSDMTAEGAFVSEAQLTRFLSRLHDVKNLILQGPPGVGKTWFAKRLAFALMGERDEERVTRVQFHQTTSYEDFVRGLRPKPDGSGAFALVDGPFGKPLRLRARIQATGLTS